MPSQRQLAQHTGLEPLYVSKLARALESASLIERVRDARDSRAVRLSLTARGHAITGRATKIVEELVDQLLAPLGGLGAPRTQALARELTVLLDVSLDSAAPGSPAKE